MSRIKHAVLAVAVLAAGPGYGADTDEINWQGSGGWGSDRPVSRTYDPATVTTIAGEVVAVESFKAGMGMARGIQLRVKSGAETLVVHLGPQWFLERQDAGFQPGDPIEVTGSRVPTSTGTALIARKIRKYDATLTLRDEAGVPYWAGWKKDAAR